jgi:hypothetical protein
MPSLKLSPFHHLISLFAAIFIAATLFAGAAANAQTRTGGPTYRAELAQPVADTRVVAGGVLWSCAGNACTAARATSRPAIVCARLVREAGAVTSFAFGGTAMSATDLERCNAAAN